MGRRSPRLAELKCTRYRFLPGDRVIVRVFERITSDDRKKIQRMYQRWAGEDVEVVVVDATRFEVTIEQGGQRPEILRCIGR